MIKTPKVFLFDEPLSNLDAKLRGSLRVEIAKLHKELKTTSIYVTHDQLEAMTLADRIVLMKDGRIEQMGTPEEIYQKPATLFAAGFIGTPSMNFLKLNVSDNKSVSDEINFSFGSVMAHGEVILGVRPGAFKMCDGGGAFTGRVERNEFHGETRLLTVKNSSQEINVAVPASTIVAEGSTVSVDVEPKDMHLFDPKTERRI